MANTTITDTSPRNADIEERLRTLLHQHYSGDECAEADIFHEFGITISETETLLADGNDAPPETDYESAP